ncbi:MAG: 30S ribosomal protein S7 [Methanobacteriota archaeon]|nr:MAG: 30S ribosomal protein S7 [Euryarchaeota archaeon]
MAEETNKEPSQKDPSEKTKPPASDAPIEPPKTEPSEAKPDKPDKPDEVEKPAETDKAEKAAEETAEKKPEKPQADIKPKAVPSPLKDVLLFGKFDVSEVEVADAGIARYIDISPIAVPHTGGKHSSRAFGKSKMSIVERLINGMMRTEDFTGKKIKSYRAVEDAFVLIHEKTDRNPLQMLVDALQNAAPREEVTRLQYGGISVPKAVDVAPARRVDLALRHLCQGALESSHKSKKPIGECLADEIIAAANGDVTCHSVAKKEEVERVSASAR